MNDHELLQRYIESRCETSFTELVNRYLDLVYSAALRQVGGDAHLAHDVTQGVFIDLARKADSFSGRRVLAGWLYTSTHYAAAKIVRSEQRWRAREQEANSMRQLLNESSAEPAWEELRPVIDQAMHELNPTEREAILLRYFEKRQLGEVGARLGVSEDAARKRVDRGLEKLRGLLARRGVTSTSGALVAILGTQMIAAAPAGMAATIAGTAMASAAGTGTTLTILKIMAMSKLKVGLVGAVIVAGMAAPLIIQNQSQAKLRMENQQLQQQNVQLIEQITPLSGEIARLSNRIAQARENQSAQQNQSNELLRLRAEVARLRVESRNSSRSREIGAGVSDDPALQALMQRLAARVTQLRQRLEHMPGRKIPELKFLPDKDWLGVVGEFEKLESEEEFSSAMSDLRGRAKGAFGGMMRNALRRFAEANNGLLPTDITQLQPYFEQPVELAALQRYQIVESGKLADVAPDKTLIKETGPRVDDDYDSHYEFSLNGTSSHSGSRIGEELEKAAEEYAKANGGLLPKTPEQLASYLQQEVEPVRMQKFLSEIPASVTTLEQLKGVVRR